MSIIEREIDKRQAIIDGKSEKEERLKSLKLEVETLEAEIASIDTEALVAEILELKSYLPQPEVEQPVDIQM